MRHLLIAMLSACAFAPQATGTDGGGTSGGGGDARGSGGGSNGSGSATCTPGTRVCVDAMDSGTCDGAGHETADRHCPPASTCSGGYCQPPQGASGCTSDKQCAGQDVCDLYVQGGVLTGYCTMPSGTSSTYDHCTSDAQCATGICANGGECFSECSGQSSCPNGPDVIDCTALAVTIEGVASIGVSTCTGHSD